MEQTRKLAAIMFTDIVGYTALMGSDEEKAFTILELNRKIHKLNLEKFNGIWLKELGDGVLASFDTITDAVLCAQQIREECEKQGLYRLRIGIHQGEVVFENDDVFGDGVNIASRIQAAAPPGVIYLSDPVARNFDNKKGLVISFAGEKELKNVSYPVPVYELLKEGETAITKPLMDKKNTKKTSLRNRIIYVVITLFCLVGGYFIINQLTGSKKITGEKTVAVLPFKNLTPSDSNNVFVSGIHEDVINRLAGLKDLKVISRTSVLRFNDSKEDLKTIGKELRANYIVEGSVARMNNQIRVNIQLFDASNEESLWSESYEKELSNVFAVQSEIAEKISDKLNAKLSSREKDRLETIPTDNVKAYDDFILARSILNSSQLTYDKTMQAIGLLQSAIEKDKKFAEAWGLLSQAQTTRYEKVINYDDRKEEQLEAAAESEKALAKVKDLDPDGVSAYRAEGYYLNIVKNDQVGALRSFDKALEVFPNDPRTLIYQSFLFFYMGQMHRVVENMEKAYEMENRNGMIIYALTFGYELTRQYSKMPEFFEKLLEIEPEKTQYKVNEKYFQFLADGSLASFHEFENAVKTVERTKVYDERSIENNEMVVAMVNNEIEEYASLWEGKWLEHYKGHGNWSCPMIINDEVNQAYFLINHGKKAEAASFINKVKSATSRPINEKSLCTFNKAVYEPKLIYLTGDSVKAREAFEATTISVLKNNKFPRGAVEKSVLLQTADMVAPDKVYEIYKEVSADPVSFISMEVVCANPWTYPNLLKDPRFIKEVRKDGRFVKFLEHYGVI